MMQPTDVYRLYAGDLEVQLDMLYVGISSDARQRFRQHRRREFWELVSYATITRYSTRLGAEIVEADAIAREFPVFNIYPGSRAARTGDAESVDWNQFEGYVEFHVGMSNQWWAA